MDKEITIRQAQELVDKWIKKYGVRYFSELTNMTVLTEEIGEMARIMARRYGDQSFKPGEKDNLGDEMADVLWVLLCIANQTGIDLTAELQRNIEKKTLRDSTRHINNPKLKKKTANTLTKSGSRHRNCVRQSPVKKRNSKKTNKTTNI